MPSLCRLSPKWVSACSKSKQKQRIRHHVSFVPLWEKNMEPIRVVELFAGVGGFRLGLEQASERFHIIWANQWEPSMREQYAFDCYTAHYGISENLICKDIALAKNSIPDHDLLVGGFPCQDYSIAKRGLPVLRGRKVPSGGKSMILFTRNALSISCSKM